MIDVWLVRHGEAAASWDQDHDPGLSPVGQQQAETAAARLQQLTPDDVRLLTSPKARARETGEPFARLRGSSLHTAAAFTEVQAPVPLEQRKDWLRRFMAQTWPEQTDALWAWRRAILETLTAQQQPAVIFSHFLVINAVLAEVSGDPTVLQAWPANGSIHHFRIDDGRLALVALGEQMGSVVN